MAEHNDLGKWGEDEAVFYLEDKGYTIIDRDWRLGRRDLDIGIHVERRMSLVN